MREATSTGFEPMRAEPSRFRVYRLNHSAKMPKAVPDGRRCALTIEQNETKKYMGRRLRDSNSRGNAPN